jgi:hypothetical protein
MADSKTRGALCDGKRLLTKLMLYHSIVYLYADIHPSIKHILSYMSSMSELIEVKSLSTFAINPTPYK